MDALNDDDMRCRMRLLKVRTSTWDTGRTSNSIRQICSDLRLQDIRDNIAVSQEGEAEIWNLLKDFVSKGHDDNTAATWLDGDAAASEQIVNLICIVCRCSLVFPPSFN
jgi:hypothetical protein